MALSGKFGRCLSAWKWSADCSRYWAFKNSESMDGLPGMRRGVETAKREDVKPIKKMVGPYGEIVNRMKARRANTVSVWYLIIVALFGHRCDGVDAISD
jgi:hypothetical protein